jgi:cytosine/adenosine deaminase-related metal-dependent hydrolase
MKTKISGGWVIGFDGTKHVLLEDSDVVFENDRVIFVGPRYQGQTDHTIPASGRLVLPGFINIHSHSLTSPLLYRGICEDEGPVLYRYLLPLRFGTPTHPPFASGEDAYLMSRLTLLELLKSGVTTVFEQTNNLEDVLRIGQQLGIRLYGCHSYFNGMPYEESGKVVYPTFKDTCPEFEENLRMIRRDQDLGEGRIKVWLGPHAPDTCSVDLLQETRKKADELKVGIGTHVAQSLTELNEIKRRFQKSPVEFLDSLGFWGDDVIAAHAIHTNDADVAIMARSKMTVAHCAGAYVKSGQRAPMAIYRKGGVNVVLGTDQEAMDMIGEMRLALFSSKLNEGDPFATTCLDVYNAITLNAAKALGRNDIGRIASGAKADIILVDVREPHWMPFRDVLKMLVYHGNRGDVDTVIVDGRVLMSGRNVLIVNEEEIIAKASEAARRIWQKADSEIGLPPLILKPVRQL